MILLYHSYIVFKTFPPFPDLACEQLPTLRIAGRHGKKDGNSKKNASADDSTQKMEEQKQKNLVSLSNLHNKQDEEKENVIVCKEVSFGDTAKDVEANSEHQVEECTEDIHISGEIDLESLSEHFLHAIQVENEFFIKHQMSKVKLCCEEMLLGAQKELCQISETHLNAMKRLKVLHDTKDGLAEVKSKMNEITEKFDSILNLCRSILDRQDETEKRISTLDIHVADMNEEREKSCNESLKETLRKKENELSAAESAMNCNVCQDRRRDCVLMPCMHMHTCFRCIKAIRRSSSVGNAKCPICRSTIQGEIHLKLD